MNPKQMATIDRGHEVLVQCSPINSADSGFRRGTFIGWSDQRGLFNLIDFGKRVLASPAKVFHFDGAAFSGREFVISDPIKIEIGQERVNIFCRVFLHSLYKLNSTCVYKYSEYRIQNDSYQGSEFDGVISSLLLGACCHHSNQEHGPSPNGPTDGQS